MDHRTPLLLIPGSWDDMVARAALKAADWVHDRLRQRAPTLVSAPPPADPWVRLLELGGKARGLDQNQKADERPARDRP